MSDRIEMRELVSPDHAREVIGAFDPPDDTEIVSIERASGRTLAESIDAGIDVPGFERASMDGYALRAGDTTGAGEEQPVTLQIAGRLEPGQEPTTSVESTTAIEIATGAVMPEGANAVVPVERCEERGSTVAVRKAVAPGANVMAAGTDVAAGDRALSAGTYLAPRTIGLLAAIGRESIPVQTVPTVGIIPTGEELIEPGTNLTHRAGEIYDVNGVTLANAVRDIGAEPIQYGIAPDDEREMADILSRAGEECDLILTAGSTSAGSGDILYRLVESRGTLTIHGIAIKPGKPTIVGRYEGTPLIGLPGFPVSALSIFRLFVAPALRSWTEAQRQAPTVSGRLAVAERYDEGRHRLVPAGVLRDGSGDLLIYPVDRGSGATTSLAYADGIFEMDADTLRLDAGETVRLEMFSPDWRVPKLLAVGERDPGFLCAIDTIEETRYRTTGSAGGHRSLADGVPDVAVVTGNSSFEKPVTQLGQWTRAWGLLLAPDTEIESIVELAHSDLRFVNRDRRSGLRGAFENAIDDLDEPATIRDAIEGYDIETQGIDSPAHRIERGDADAGLGLASTAAGRGLDFLELGEQRVSAIAPADRVNKPAVSELADWFETGNEFDDLVGYRALDT